MPEFLKLSFFYSYQNDSCFCTCARYCTMNKKELLLLIGKQNSFELLLPEENNAETSKCKMKRLNWYTRILHVSCLFALFIVST